MKSERSFPIYKVNKKAEASLVGGHPWVYENDILEFPETEPENGTLADVVSPKGAYLGTGFVSLKSKIRVRLISRNANDTFDASFWRRRVEYAWAYRKTVLEPADLSACRVIFGEADQFPGLTVDRFNNILVTQTLSVGMEKLKPLLFPLLAEVLLVLAEVEGAQILVAPLSGVALVGGDQIGFAVHLEGGDAVGHPDAHEVAVGLGGVGVVLFVDVDGGDAVVLKARGVDPVKGTGGQIQHGDGIVLLQGDIGLAAGYGDILRLQVRGGIDSLLQHDPG